MRSIFIFAAIAALSAGGAHAVSVTSSGTDLAAAQAGEAAFLAGKTVVATEDFETFTDGDRATSYVTDFGTFTDNSPVTIHDGTGFGILSSTTTNFGGRSNTTPDGDLWLDSFDSTNVILDLILPASATGIGFFMTDLNDQGGDTEVELFDSADASLGSFDLAPGKQSNGSVFYQAIDFMGADVSKLQFTQANTSDGWGIDDISVTAPIPLPAAGWMLLAGAGVLAGVARRRSR